jgi:hypothetical protein
MYKDDLQYCFCKMFEVFYAINLCICVFITCATSYCLYDTFGSTKYISVCVCVCVCERESECVSERVNIYIYIPEQMKDQAIAYHSPQTLSSSMDCTNVGDHLQPGNTNMLELTEEIKQHYTKEARF